MGKVTSDFIAYTTIEGRTTSNGSKQNASMPAKGHNDYIQKRKNTVDNCFLMGNKGFGPDEKDTSGRHHNTGLACLSQSPQSLRHTMQEIPIRFARRP
ncbi:MAG: hypothetical protein V8T86_16440 [Victivallis sp.]